MLSCLSKGLFFGFCFVYLPVWSINTSGMSITLLTKQNVYRYYAPTDHTLTIVYKTSSVFQFHVSPLNGLSPALFLLVYSIIYLNHKGLKLWWLTVTVMLWHLTDDSPGLRRTTAQSNSLNTSIHIDSLVPGLWISTSEELFLNKD